jgi:hypothetical protein
MIIAMILAHLVGDFILQWDALAKWKSYALRGVLAHGLIVLGVTALFALPFSPFWWSGVLFIGLSHIAIDAVQLYVRPAISPLLRFILDQLAHFLIIGGALIAGGYLSLSTPLADVTAAAQATPWLTAVTVYAFITMPAWVVLKFTVYAVVEHAPPNFPAKPSKYVGITERLLIATCVALGQVLLIPLIALPRLIAAWPQVKEHRLDRVYVAEFVASAGLAIGTGLLLRGLMP